MANAANAWQIRFQPTTLALTPKANGTFTSIQIQPGNLALPANAFQVVIAATPRLTETNAGHSPLPAGSKPQPATVEFIGGAKPETPKGAKPIDAKPVFFSLGILKGKVDFNTDGATTLPRFTASTTNVAGNSILDFAPATTPAVVANSDWVLRIRQDPDTFLISVAQSFFVHLPWQFIENTGIILLSARLTVGGTLAADEKNNTPLDIRLKHENVPEEAKPGKTRLVFFGVRNLYTKSNAKSLPVLKIGGGKLTVVLDSTFTDFCTQKTGATVQAVIDAATTILNDAGFKSMDFLQGTPAITDCNLHWKSAGGHFMGRKITDPDQTQPDADKLENRFSEAISNNNVTFQVPAGMEEVIPFFTFYIFAETSQPSVPDELAISEYPASNPPSAPGTKTLLAPIAFATQTGSPLKNQLRGADPLDHANILANTLCHEIGHSFGLRHSVAFVDHLPYVTGDATFTGGIMGPSPGARRVALEFFGPVHVAEIKRLFL